MPQARRLSALKSIAAITFSTFVAMAVTVVPAHADQRRDAHHDDRDRRHDDHGHRGYPPPPVVYAPYYAPPPVVYGPSVGVYLPGISIGIH